MRPHAKSNNRHSLNWLHAGIRLETARRLCSAAAFDAQRRCLNRVAARHSLRKQVDGNPRCHADAKQDSENAQIFNRRERLTGVGHMASNAAEAAPGQSWSIVIGTAVASRPVTAKVSNKQRSKPQTHHSPQRRAILESGLGG